MLISSLDAKCIPICILVISVLALQEVVDKWVVFFTANERRDVLDNRA